MIKSISFWEKKWLDRKYDVVIVGAGFVGLSAAIHYKQAKPEERVLVLERGVISYGASTKNAGFSCFGSIGELEDDRNSTDLQTILDTVQMRYDGLQKLRELVGEKEMEYEQHGAWELFTEQESYDRAFAQMGFWNEKLIPIVGSTVFMEDEINKKGFYPKAIYNPHEGQLNPKLAVEKLATIARKLGVEFLYGTELVDWLSKQDCVQLNTKEGLKLKTRNLFLATNAFTKKLISNIDVKPARNQVLITEEIPNLKWRGCFHMDKGYIYFRNVGKRILLGGARNISSSENVADYGNTNEIMEYLEQFLQSKILPESRTVIEHWWSGILGIGAEKRPIIKKYEEGVFMAVRLGGMGVAIGSKVGEELVELVLKNED